LLGAGRSRRFKSNQIKQNVIINKVSILNHSRLFFNKYFPQSNIFIVCNRKVVINKLKNNENVVYGSSSRLKSLHVALENIFQNNLQTKFTLVHDIARPVLNINDIKRLIRYPLTNALKDVKNSKVLNNLYKDRLWSSFTPQIFKTTKLYESIVKIISSGYDIDDDIEAMMMNDFNCSIVRSSPDNIKVTFKEDIEVIKRLL
jgi:2-C-methyl-D-erythritol 4-phosphate cytidylyltransferase